MTRSGPVHWFRTVAGTRPLVLIHGFTGAPESWAPVVASQPAGQAIAALSLPGHHPAFPVAPGGFSANIDALAAQLTRLRDAAPDLAGAHVCGYSLGARSALGMAVRHPRLIGRLTLIGVHPGLADSEQRDARIRADRRFVDLLRSGGIDEFVAVWRDLPIFASQRDAPAERRASQARIRANHDPEELARSLEQMGLGVMPDFRARIADLPMPITLVTGALDRKFTALAEHMCARAASVEHRMIAECGHNPLIERPAELAALLTAIEEE